MWLQAAHFGLTTFTLSLISRDSTADLCREDLAVSVTARKPGLPIGSGARGIEQKSVAG
jgi:hypothetical protein